MLPPNTQGFAQLQQMEMAERFDLAAMGRNSADYLHTLIELKKVAFADRDQWASDPAFSDIPLERLLDSGYLEEGHPNQVSPGKRPYHTLTPLMALNPDGGLAFTLGTPGGDSQTQSLLAIVNNLLLFDMTPQEAIEAPRYRSYPGLRVDLEDRIPAAVRAELAQRGHDIRVVHGWTATFGGAQMILVEPGNGTLTVASDPRREAYGIAW